MKPVRHLAMLVIAAAATFPVSASTISFASNSTAANASENNSNGPNVVIPPNTAWATALAGSQWISYTQSGDPNSPGYVQVPNGTIVSFYQNFTLNASDLSTDGTVSLYADDSSGVVLNGHTLVNEASSNNNNYVRCSDTTPNCVTLTTVDLPSADLVVGNNVLRFDTAQRNGSSFGLDYAGSAGAPASTPEPSTYASLATGMLALGFGFRRVSRKSASAPAAH